MTSEKRTEQTTIDQTTEVERPEPSVPTYPEVTPEPDNPERPEPSVPTYPDQAGPGAPEVPAEPDVTLHPGEGVTVAPASGDTDVKAEPAPRKK